MTPQAGCADDINTYLTEEDVEAIVADNGYARLEIFSGFLDLVDLVLGRPTAMTTLSSRPKRSTPSWPITATPWLQTCSAAIATSWARQRSSAAAN